MQCFLFISLLDASPLVSPGSRLRPLIALAVITVDNLLVPTTRSLDGTLPPAPALLALLHLYVRLERVASRRVNLRKSLRFSDVPPK